MNLKEAFRYQNDISIWINTTQQYLMNENIIMQIVEEHLKNKVNPDTEDEKVDKSLERDVPYTANDLLKFYDHLINTKIALSEAIRLAKRNTEIDIDAEIANNKLRHDVALRLNVLANKRPSETTRRGSDLKFNVEGNQVGYYYDIRETKTIDFDRKKVREMSKHYSRIADEISTKIDKIMLEDIVDFELEFDPSDSYDDAIREFLGIKDDDYIGE